MHFLGVHHHFVHYLVFTHAFGDKAVDTIGPSQSAVTALSYPIVSTALSMALLQETLTLAQAFGGGLILFSIYQVIKK